MIRRFVTVILALMPSAFVLSAKDVVVSGVVRNGEGKPLSSVMVRVVADNGKGPFVMTDGKGSYSVAVAEEDSVISFRFSKFGYETENVSVENRSQSLDMVLSRSASTLREVTVKAPEVRIKGDTVSFLLSAFMGKGDVSLKDALKKLPGLEVAKSGEISYNGKKISNFYIEGMDLLGGKYDLATTNIPASYVNAVEVLNNHQDVKIDRGVFNDNVALNVRLKPKAMFRPVGRYGLKGGYGNRIPVEASGAGMMFRDDLQSMLTLKGSDISEFSGRENMRFYGSGGERLRNLASEVLGNLSVSSPPLERNRWIKPWDASVNVNSMKKLSEDENVRAGVGYSFLKTEYDYSDARIYFDGEDGVEIRQLSAPESWRHTPLFSVEYRNNSDNLYVFNELTGAASFTDRTMPVVSSGSSISQNQEMIDFDFSDVFYLKWRRGRMRWDFTSVLEYQSSPKGTVTSESGLFGLCQSGRSYSFLVSESFSGVLETGGSRISFPLNVRYADNRIRTGLTFDGMDKRLEAVNRIDGSDFRISLSPGYEFDSGYGRFVVRVSCPVGLDYIDWCNKGSVPYSQTGFHFSMSPSFYANYKVTGTSTFRLTASYSSKIGDILDLMTAPVMTDYLSMNYRSGILSKNKVFEVAFHYNLNLPVSMWYSNADIRYSAVRGDRITSRTVSSDLIAVTDFYMPNLSERVSGGIGVSKNIGALKSKIGLRCSYSWSRNVIEQNGMPVTYYGQGVSLSPSLSGNPLGWFSMSYSGSFACNYSRYLGRRQSFSTQSHNATVSFFPVDAVEIKGGLDVMRREISDDRFKTMSLFDTGVVYKAGKFRLSFNVRNILDSRSYSYTVFSGVDRFIYDFSLCGREFIAGLEFSL